MPHCKARAAQGCRGLGTGCFQQRWGRTRAGLPPADLGLWAVPAAPALPLTPPIAFPSLPEAAGGLARGTDLSRLPRPCLTPPRQHRGTHGCWHPLLPIVSIPAHPSFGCWGCPGVLPAPHRPPQDKAWETHTLGRAGRQTDGWTDSISWSIPIHPGAYFQPRPHHSPRPGHGTVW